MHGTLQTEAGWYAVYCNIRCERRVQMGLERLGYPTMMLLKERACGPRNLFPRYLLVKFDSHRDPWSEIKEVDGVQRLLTSDGIQPRRVPDELIGLLAMGCAAGLYNDRALRKTYQRRRRTRPRATRRVARAMRVWLREQALALTTA